MKKIYLLLGLAAITTTGLLLTSEKETVAQQFYKGFRKPSEAPHARKHWDAKRLSDPSIGKMPNGIRKKELAFARTLPNDSESSNLQWTMEGPFNVGGRTRALAMDVTDENILLAGGATGGMWRSTDQGLSWDKMTRPFQLHNVTCIAQDTRAGKENIWYHGTGELSGSSASGGGAYFDGNGIYKSIDGGVTWDSIPITADNSPATGFNHWDFIWNIKTDPSNSIDDIVYAATYGAVYRSEDGGDSWSKQLGDLNNAVYYTNIEVTSSGVVYAALSSDGIDKGIWRSDDGLNWNRIHPSTFPSTYGRTAIAVNPSNENELYFLTAETDGAGQHTNTFFGGETWTSFYKYTYLCGDGSDTCGVWEDLSANIPNNRPTTFDNFNAQGGYDLLVKVKPDEPNVVFIGGTNLWRSTDGFTSDTNTTQVGGYFEGSYHGQGNWDVYDTHHPDQHELLFLPSNPDVIFNGNDGGVYMSNDCMATPHNWVRLNNGYQTTQAYSVEISKDAGNPIILAGFQDNGNFVTFSNNPTDPWTMPFNGDGTYSAIADNNEDFYLQIQRGVLYKMKLDNTGAVLAFNRMDPLDADTGDYQFINQMCMVPDNDDILYLPEGNTLWRQSDAGNFPYNNDHNRLMNGWTELAPPLGGADTNLSITAVAASSSIEDIMYYGFDEQKLFRIEDASTTPVHVEITSSLFPTEGFITDICVDPTNGYKLIVTFSNYGTNSVFYSENAGQTWGNISGNLEEFLFGSMYTGGGNGPSCRSAQILYVNGSPIYLMATSTGLYATDSLAPYSSPVSNVPTTEWRQIGTDIIGNVVIENITVRQSDGKLVVGTHGTGIYSTYITDLEDIFPTKIENNIALANFLVYPNPTQGKVYIQCEEADELIVSDALGKVFYRQDDPKAQTILESDEWPAGIYYITLKKGTNQRSEKLVVL